MLVNSLNRQQVVRGLWNFPLPKNDIGVPTTPEGRVIKPIDEDVIDQGYDSDGLRAPWDVNEKEDLDGPLEEEDPLPHWLSKIYQNLEFILIS